MKKIKYIITAAIAIILAAGCSLDEKNYVDVEKKNFMRNAKEAETVLKGVYRNLVKEDLYGQNLSILFTLPTDQAKIEGNSTDNYYRSIGNANFETNQNNVERTWSALYRGIYDANDFIERLEKNIDGFTEQDQAEAKGYIGEAKTLRALFYFELVRWYGNIALVKTTAESYRDPKTVDQVKPEVIYQYIEQDLKDAAAILPEDPVGAFRLSRYSALGLLTKVYATWAGFPVKDETKWQLAAETGKIVVNSNKHKLLENFDDLWKNSANSVWDKNESLIEVSFFAPIMSGQASNDPVGRIGKFNGVVADKDAFGPNSLNIEGKWRILPTFLWKWDERENDARWAISFNPVKKYLANGEIEYYTKDGAGFTFEDAIVQNTKRDAFCNTMTPGKWSVPKYCKDNILPDKNYSNTNWYLLRYADVLLLYAEALNEWKGVPTTEAEEALNKVRKRAGLGELSGLDQTAFREAVRTERSHELAFEGHRKQDLVRWGIYPQTIRQAYYDQEEWHEIKGPATFTGALNVTAKHNLLPIPQRELDLLKKFKQNKYW